MRTIFVIAKNTFREAIRDRILYGILGFAALYLCLDLFFAKLALGDLVMIRSFGLAGIYVFGLVVTVFLGSTIINKELERRTLYFVLSKPVSRRDIVIGKWAGLYAAIAATILAMTAIYLALILSQGGGFDALGLYAVALELLELALLTSLFVFLSTIATPLTATICGILLIFGGHAASTMLQNTTWIGGMLYRMVLAFYYLFPNLEKFDGRAYAVHSISLPPPAFIAAFFYALLYIVLLLALATFFLKRKEL